MEQRGQQTEQITKHFSVLLRRNRKSTLRYLQYSIANYGLRPSNRFGTKINFRNCILIMTSNVDSQYGLTSTIGFEGKENLKNQEKVKKEFAPEFLNRLDATIYFNRI